MLNDKKLKDLVVFSIFFWVVFGLVIAACGASLIGKPIYKQFEVYEGSKWFEAAGEHGVEVLFPPVVLAVLLYLVIVFVPVVPLSKKVEH